MIDWLVLTAALPTSPSGLRVRIWRSLKATGCATLRDGVYLLPANVANADALWDIEKAIREAGASAHMLELKARDAAQEASFVALFDRTEHYADFTLALKEARKLLRSGAEPELRKLLRALDQQLHAIQAIDFFAAQAGARAAAGLAALRLEVERRFSPGEPLAAPEHGIERLRREDFQGRSWATRRRPWVDRLACAWLIQRFIDAAPRFVWLSDPAKCPKRALGFDFDGARFTHVGGQVSVQVLARSFGLDEDAAMRRLGELVRYIDVGGIPVDEAVGVETLVRGLQAQHPEDDDALLAAACSLFDTLYAALKSPR
ncbi:MAG TPA: chromate resistance protein ChrB domain-containing protein [Variovorax sp.]|nr:chromate resistance protein ChrB domain-containing protein [Variovorax sp.]